MQGPARPLSAPKEQAQMTAQKIYNDACTAYRRKIQPGKKFAGSQPLLCTTSKDSFCFEAQNIQRRNSMTRKISKHQNSLKRKSGKEKQRARTFVSLVGSWLITTEALALLDSFKYLRDLYNHTNICGKHRIVR